MTEVAINLGWLLKGYLLDIGTPESYREAQMDVLRLGKYWAGEDPAMSREPEGFGS